MRLLFVFSAGLLLIASNVSAQYKYQQNYFRNPLDIPIQLAANFGELRPNHFHMGLDIRTQGRENLSIHAAAEGYVSRIKIEKWGYGKAIYITHPAGFVTLYAHLNSFYPELENFIKERQYEEQRWEQDLDFEAGEFTVIKGQFIARSGNTGASGGPHLHFEIRDAETGNNLNPLMFGMGIPDRVPPTIEKLFLYDRRYSTYQAPAKQIPIKAIGSNYTTVPAIIKTGTPLLSLGITAEDKTSNSPFKFGIYQAELWMDDSLLSAFQLDDFSYDDTRYVNACIDYTKFIKEKVYVQHLSILPGNRLGIFSEAGGTGVIILPDTLPHKININVKDVNGNVARLIAMLQFDKTLQQQHFSYPSGAQPVVPNQSNIIKSDNAQVNFPQQSFYDTAPFFIQEQSVNTPGAASSKFSFPNYIPVHDSFRVQLKTTLTNNDPRRNNVVMFFTNGRSKDAVKGTWTGDYMSVKFKRLTVAQLVIDTNPPLVTAVWKTGAKITGRTLRLHCTDELDEVASFKATLENGQWLLFAKKNDDFIYTFDEYCPPGPHQLTVTVTDKAGNETTKAFSFTK